MTDTVEPVPVALIDDLRRIIETGRGRAAQAVNSELVWLYWHVGTRLRQDVVGQGRGAYGEQVVWLGRAICAESPAKNCFINQLVKLLHVAVFQDNQRVADCCYNSQLTCELTGIFRLHYDDFSRSWTI